ncbi:long-chain-fatty-acid--CoA ligase ACSBG2 isoform X1 [Synchiropus splendidus]|uniref:long-chain-fatty-acid--CoA ligase ACSBG2 isoform X1 n=1 Tax=Synchiropus splendidus TaxID=270530 RepID=UPI00237EAED3|nr:long-chain-fatty-acid--CoA ligase ACSBG2 isoform X1 [Synchiropus splendidus]
MLCLQVTAGPATMTDVAVMNSPMSGDLLESSLASAVVDTANESSEEEPTVENGEVSGPSDDELCSPIPIANTEAVSSQRPQSLPLSAAAELGLWTSQIDGEVKLRMESSGMAARQPCTIHDVFVSTVKNYGDFTALGWKEGDQQKTMTYREYYQSCRTAAKSFLKLGLERFHGVCILGFNSAEWLIADLGAILAGGLGVGVYSTNSPEACHYVAENCKANIIVVENDKQLQKILEVEDRLPHLKAIIQYKDQVKKKRPNLYSWAEFMALGRDEPDGPLDQIISTLKPNQCCLLIYTSGTTGQPKGVMISHDNITWTSYCVSKYVCLKSPTESQERVVSYLPLSHIAAQLVDIWITMTTGAATYFANPDALKGSLVTTLKEVRPTAFMGVPRVWEKMQESMQSAGSKASILRRKVAVWAKSVGLKKNMKDLGATRLSQRSPLSYRLAKKLVFTRVREALGLDRCRLCYTGAAPITKDTLEFFLSLNIPVYELYGMSECTGPHTMSYENIHRLTSCGMPISKSCKTKLNNPDADGNGEVCFWGRHVFMGYLNMPEKTEEALDAEGWLHSGDLGKHDRDGFLYITGRIKELIITAGGENIPPVPIEDEVKKALPLISNAMLIGDKRKFLAMLLTIKCKMNPDTGSPEDDLTDEAVEICRKLGSSATRVSDIVNSKDPAVYTALQKGIDEVNKVATSNAQRIQKWIILDHDFSIAGEELGPTMKLKRPTVTKLYAEQIENIYKEMATPVSPVSPDNPLPPK